MDSTTKNYTITAPIEVSRWSMDEAKATLYNEQCLARNADIATMLRDLFDGYRVQEFTEHAWVLPAVILDEASAYSGSIKTIITDNGFLRLTYSWGYGKNVWKALKLQEQPDGKTHLIDSTKAKAAAKALLDTYLAQIAATKANQAYNANAEVAQTEAFAQLRPALEAQGVVFSSTTALGGTILLGEHEYGPRIEVKGNRVHFKAARYTRDEIAVRWELIPDFVALFARNREKTP